MKRLCILMHSFGGGAEHIALTLARHLDTAQLHTRILCTRYVPALPAHIAEHIPYTMPARSGLWAAYTHLFTVWRATRAADVVLGSLELQSIFWAALFAPGRAVAWLHKDVEGYLRGKGRIYALIYRTVLGFALRRCRHVACVSQGVLYAAVRLWPAIASYASVLWNPVDTEDLRRRARQALPAALTPIFTQPVILAVGRLAPQKSFEYVLDAHRILIQRGLHHHLCILGEGPQRPHLETLIRQWGLKDTAFLPGFYDPCHCMAHSKVLALSSVFEGLPTVIIEALALGLPVVAADCPSGPREVLCEGRYGELVPMRQPKALADALQVHLEQNIDPQRRTAGQERAEDFALSKTIAMWQGVLCHKHSPTSDCQKF